MCLLHFHGTILGNTPLAIFRHNQMISNHLLLHHLHDSDVGQVLFV